MEKAGHESACEPMTSCTAALEYVKCRQAVLLLCTIHTSFPPSIARGNSSRHHCSAQLVIHTTAHALSAAAGFGPHPAPSTGPSCSCMPAARSGPRRSAHHCHLLPLKGLACAGAPACALPIAARPCAELRCIALFCGAHRPHACSF